MKNYFISDSEEFRVINLYYDRDLNIFIDHKGLEVIDIFKLVTPSDLSLFRENDYSIMVRNRKDKRSAIKMNYMDEVDNILELIERRERQMLIHSYIYYVGDENIWTDKEFNERAVELAKLIKEYPDKFEKSEWRDSFKDWDGSSGAFLPLQHPWVMKRGEYILALHYKGGIN